LIQLLTVNSSSSDTREMCYVEVLVAESLAPDERTVHQLKHRMIVSTIMCSGGQWLVAPDKPTPGKA
jgi:hypothetical protein